MLEGTSFTVSTINKEFFTGGSFLYRLVCIEGKFCSVALTLTSTIRINASTWIAPFLWYKSFAIAIPCMKNAKLFPHGTSHKLAYCSITIKLIRNVSHSTVLCYTVLHYQSLVVIYQEFCYFVIL